MTDQEILNFYNNDFRLLSDKIYSYVNRFELYLKKKTEYCDFILDVHVEFEEMSENIDSEIIIFINKIEEKTKKIIEEYKEDKSKKLSQIFSKKIGEFNEELESKLDNVKKRMEITINVRIAQEMKKK